MKQTKTAVKARKRQSNSFRVQGRTWQGAFWFAFCFMYFSLGAAAATNLEIPIKPGNKATVKASGTVLKKGR